MNKITEKENFFTGLIDKVKCEAKLEGKSCSIFIKKGLREVKASNKKNENRVILYSANTFPKDLFSSFLSTISKEVIIIKFANSSSLSKVFKVNFPINIAALNYLPANQSLNILKFKNED